MTYVLEFSLEGLPKPFNAIKSWRTRFSEARKWKQAVYAAIDYSKRPASPLDKAKVTIIRHSSVEADFDGMVSAGKYLLDGLKLAGVIVDDKASVIGQPTYIWAKAKQRQGKVTVKVEAA